MTIQIISAEERMQETSGVKLCILGEHGIGKTSLVKTLDPKKTFFVNMEAGMLAVKRVKLAKTTTIRDWNSARTLAVWIGGPDPSKQPDQLYSQAHHDFAVQQLGDPAEVLKGIDTIFWDSITEMSRVAFAWSQGQPDAFSEKTGKPDTRGAYGLVGREVLGLLRHVQHTPDKNIVFVGGLRKVVDDYGRPNWMPMVEGGKTAQELDGIFDEVITMAEMLGGDQQKYRVFVTRKLNEWGYPAKDRSGQLNPVEEPNLGKLLAKIAGDKLDPEMEYGLPPEPEATDPTAPVAAPAPEQAPVWASQQQPQQENVSQ